MNLSSKIGPLPAWGWAAAAGGSVAAVLVLRRIRAKRATSSAGAVAAATGTPDYSGQGLPNPMLGGAGTASGYDYQPPGEPAYPPTTVAASDTEPEPSGSPELAPRPPGRPKLPPTRHLPPKPKTLTGGLYRHPAPVTRHAGPKVSKKMPKKAPPKRTTTHRR